MGENTNNYNKSYYTARGIPQPGAEEVTDREKQKLAQSEKKAEGRSASGPGDDAGIARAMGRTPGPNERS